MTTQSNLEIKGNLREHPLAELLLEISQTNLSGSIRLSNAERKAVVYLNEGRVVFAVSNQREHRLFEMLVREKRFPAKQIVELPNFTNDLELGKNLVRNQMMRKSEVDEFFVRQIKEILQSVFDWKDGEWIFSSLARIKESINFHVNVQKISVEYARNLPKTAVVPRFRSLQESFRLKPNPAEIDFLPKEAFVLSRFEDSALNVDDVKTLSGLSDFETLHIIYVLWLGGLISRQSWNTAFSDRKIADILSAKITLKKEETPRAPAEIKAETAKPVVEEAPKIPEKSAEQREREEKFLLEEYLDKTERASNHYETLNVATKAAAADIKKVYFAFARQFHPDLFQRKAEPELLTRIQNAFTKVARAYETLKDDSTREVYDFKLRKELEDAETWQASEDAGETVDLQGQEKMAAEYYKSGFGLLMDELYEDAVPYLGRAVHLAPDNARYHAFYGKALSFDEKTRHKAESEMQSAVRLDPNNETYRIILAEFFIQQELFRRAEGELKRLLAIAPDNAEAKGLLDSLPQK
jgi:curved DNA-binding protein CbpA